VTVAVAVLVPRQAQADVVVEPHAKAKANVLVVHGGGFEFGTAADDRPTAEYLAAHDYRAVSIDYPLFDVRAAYRSARRKARRYHSRFAVGESVGGTIAAWLAAHRCVRAAVTQDAPMDLTRPLLRESWQDEIGLHGLRARRALSPRFAYAGQAPLLVLHFTGDPLVPATQARAMRRTGAQVRLLPGHHHVDPRYRPYALRFLESQR
jgi:acetyl esterase/lipase